MPFVTGTDRLSSFLRTFKLQVPDNRPSKKSAPIEKSFSAKRFLILSQTIFSSAASSETTSPHGYLRLQKRKEKRTFALYPEVSFCVIGNTHVVPEQFSTNYSSIVLTCRARTGLSPEERMHALRLLMEKYTPEHLAAGEKYAEKSFHRTEIIRLQIKEFSGKCKRIR